MYIILPIIAALFWAISINIEKQYLLKTIKPLELIMSRSIIYVLLISIYFYYSNSMCLNIKKIDYKFCMLFLISIVLGLIALLIFFNVLIKNKMSIAMTFIQPLIIVFGVFISYALYHEQISLKEILGIILVLSGIFIINYK